MMALGVLSSEIDLTGYFWKQDQINLQWMKRLRLILPWDITPEKKCFLYNNLMVLGVWNN